MDKEIKSLFNDELLKDLKKQSGIKNELRLLRGFENLVYEFEEDGKPYIYRVSHTQRRTRDEIKGEIEFLNFLYDKEIPVSRALIFDNSSEISEVFTNDKNGNEISFAGVIFEKAKGSKPDKDKFTRSVIRKVGEVTGLMHKLTKEFISSDEKFKRQTWEKDYIHLANNNFEDSDINIRNKWDENFSALKNIKLDGEHCGLIHTDIHSGNFFVDGDENITIFDFDDCCYYHFVNDIAMSTYYYVMMEKSKKDKTEKAKFFLSEYINGYNKVYNARESWFKYFPLMLKQREFVVYLVLKRTMDEQWLKGDGKEFMDEYKFNLENDIPYLNEDLTV